MCARAVIAAGDEPEITTSLSTTPASPTSPVSSPPPVSFQSPVASASHASSASPASSATGTHALSWPCGERIFWFFAKTLTSSVFVYIYL